MEGYGYQENGEIRFDSLIVYLTNRELPNESNFVFSEDIQGFGSICEESQCAGICRDAHCAGKLKTEISELIYENEPLKALKFSYDAAGELWIWLSPAFKKKFGSEGKLFMEILPKENVNGSVVISQLAISETKEILAAYNITELLKYRNHWNLIEIPLGAGGFDLSWQKLNKPGTLTLILKVLPLNGGPVKGDLYLHKLAIR